MTEVQRVTATLLDFTSDGAIIVCGDKKEHVVVDCGPAHIVNLKRALDRYVEYYAKKEETAA